MRRARDPQSGAQPQNTALAEDQRRIRRCVESGRSETQCLMEGLGKGLMDLAGAAVPGLLLKKDPVHGIRMGGVYPGPGRFGLTFYTEFVLLTCADLVPEEAPRRPHLWAPEPAAQRGYRSGVVGVLSSSSRPPGEPWHP